MRHICGGPRWVLKPTLGLQGLISYKALDVISGIAPPDIIAMELKRIYDRVKTIGRTLTTEERREEKQNSLVECQIKWNTANKGRWTHRLMRNVQTWIERK